MHKNSKLKTENGKKKSKKKKMTSSVLRGLAYGLRSSLVARDYKVHVTLYLGHFFNGSIGLHNTKISFYGTLDRSQSVAKKKKSIFFSFSKEKRQQQRRDNKKNNHSLFFF